MSKIKEFARPESLKPLCRFCETPLEHTFVDLGVSPLANSYLNERAMSEVEKFYPLHVYFCHCCYLVQIEELGDPAEIFSEYNYFSSFSESWLDHARSYARWARGHFKLSEKSLVIEIGSNDGYLLRFFKEAGIPVLGIEPAENVALVARERGINTDIRFFNSSMAAELEERNQKADLLVGNNVLAHVPSLNDFVSGLKRALKPEGLISMEFPHLLRLIEDVQFDTIYHEHYCYFSFSVVERIFAAQGLRIFDVELLNTHGGSLRIYACHADNEQYGENSNVQILRRREKAEGFDSSAFYERFGPRVEALKRDILKTIIAIKDRGLAIAAYGAAAKGNTLLNYCGIGRDMIDYAADRNPYKQGLYLPGSRIPIFDPHKIFETRPDYLLILPWNLRTEIASQMAGIRQWSGKFLVLIPEISVF